MTNKTLSPKAEKIKRQLEIGRMIKMSNNLDKITTELVTGQKKVDNVNHPAHYEREGAIECIEEMIMIFGKDAVADFCKCNAWKYRYRAADKNGAEDIAKSDWYMRKYEELTQKTECCGKCHDPWG